MTVCTCCASAASTTLRVPTPRMWSVSIQAERFPRFIVEGILVARCRIASHASTACVNAASWVTDKFNVPEKTLSLHSNWKVNIVLLSDGVSTRGENWEWVGCRIKPKRSKHRPSASIPLPPPTNLEIAQAAPPVGIHPTPLPCLHDTDSKTRQVKGRYRDNEQKTLQGFWRRQLAGVDLVSARFFVEKGFFNVETQAVLVQGLGISGFVTHYEPGIIWLIKQTGQSQMDWSNGSS